MANGEVPPPALPSGPSGSFFSEHKIPLLVGGAGFLVIVFLLYRHYHTASSTTSAGAACTDSNGNPGTLDINGNCISQVQTPADVSSGGLVTQNELYQDTSGLATQQEVAGVSGQLNNLANGINGKNSPSPGQAQKIGSGYLTTQSGWIHIDPGQAAWLNKNKKPIDYEPTIGVFNSISGQKLAGGTPLYATPTELKGAPK